MFELNQLIDVLAMLPGIGKKSAARISFFLLRNKESAKQISRVIADVIDNIITCSSCGNFSTHDPCLLCTSNERNDSILCIIEDPRDLQAIEETGFYNGRYHILMGSINPIEGIGPEKLRIKELLNRIKSGSFKEVLIATNPTNEGEATFLYIMQMLSEYNLKLSRLATGIPMGGTLEYSDKLTLSKALQTKQYL
jgi:recombination protein RecR